MDWHKSTGYVPDHQCGLRNDAESGYYQKELGRCRHRQLNNKPPTANSKGLRFGNYVQGREVIEEEMEAVFAGKKDAKSAMDDAVKRDNEILRKFEAANK
jgi:sn-glycerol 3-phosphate transport system substrate-binding protein